MLTLKETLDSLGTTRDEVADKLRQAGIKGRRGEVKFCPVANYLRKEGHEDPYVGYQGNDTIGTPEHIILFIDAFDQGRYPDLEG